MEEATRHGAATEGKADRRRRAGQWRSATDLRRSAAGGATIGGSLSLPPSASLSLSLSLLSSPLLLPLPLYIKGDNTLSLLNGFNQFGPNSTMNITSIFVLSLFILLVLPTTVLGDCTCDPGTTNSGSNKSKALAYKVAAIASILVAGAIGVCLPLLGRAVPALRPEKDVFFIIKAFAAGVILATGFIHVLPDAFDHLTNPCLTGKAWQFPFTGFVAMMAAIVTLMIDTLATSYFKGKADDDGNAKAGSTTVNVEDGGGDHSGALHVHTHATHGHAHGSAAALSLHDLGAADLIRHRVISQVLELGIVVHSVIIGISLGASEDVKTIRPLVAALTFHQFFEGMGLGGCITQAKFKCRAVVIMAMFFSLTTPVGIAIGIGISSSYKENSPRALAIEGILNAASAGILIYMALVDLLSADFMNPKMQANPKLQLGANASLLLGAGCMSLLAKWA